MKSINFVVLGDYSSDIAKELAKKGTATDIAIYNRKTSDTIYTWTLPITFPDKIQSLMQTINISEYAILSVTIKCDNYPCCKSNTNSTRLLFLVSLDQLKILPNA